MAFEVFDDVAFYWFLMAALFAFIIPMSRSFYAVTLKRHMRLSHLSSPLFATLLSPLLCCSRLSSPRPRSLLSPLLSSLLSSTRYA